MKRPPEQDAVAQDMHLRAALWHAPDADVGAPAHVSAQIVAAAYRAAGERPAPREAVAPAARRPWRLGASGAFASLVLAGVIGLLWRGEPPPAVRERVAEAPVAPTAVNPRPPAAGLPTTTETGAAPERMAAATASTPAPRPAVNTERRAAVRAALPRVPPDLPAAAQDTAIADVPAAAPVVVAEAAPAPAAMAPPPPPAAVMARAAAGDAARAEQTLRQSLAAAARPAAAAPAVLNLRGSAREDAPWLSALAAGAAVQWQVDGQVREAPTAWLQRLAVQAGGRWRASAEVAAAGEREVQWQRGTAMQGRLWLNDARVLWCNEDGRCEAAVLASGAGADLLKALPR